MKRTLKNGDFLLIEYCPTENFYRGDIIAYRDEIKPKLNRIISHRIVNIKGEKFFTKGDNNKNPDMISVNTNNLIGKVIAYERNGKFHRVIGGMPGLIKARIWYFFCHSGYLFFTKIKWILSAKIISESINRFWEHRIQKIKVNTKEGPVIKWIYRNRTLAQQLPNNTLQRSSLLAHILIETKKIEVRSQEPEDKKPEDRR